MDRDFWSVWAGNYIGDCSHQAMRQKQPVETCPNFGVKKYLKVVTDLKLVNGKLDECAMYLLPGAQQRKCSVHLCCLKLQILESPISTVIEILKSEDLHGMWELQLRYLCIEDIVPLGHYLGRMRNLHTLITNTLSMDDSEELEEEW